MAETVSLLIKKGKKKCLLGAPLPAAQTFSSMKSLLIWTKQVDLEENEGSKKEKNNSLKVREKGEDKREDG